MKKIAIIAIVATAFALNAQVANAQSKVKNIQDPVILEESQEIQPTQQVNGNVRPVNNSAKTVNNATGTQNRAGKANNKNNRWNNHKTSVAIDDNERANMNNMITPTTPVQTTNVNNVQMEMQNVVDETQSTIPQANKSKVPTKPVQNARKNKIEAKKIENK